MFAYNPRGPPIRLHTLVRVRATLMPQRCVFPDPHYRIGPEISQTPVVVVAVVVPPPVPVPVTRTGSGPVLVPVFRYGGAVPVPVPLPAT